MATNCENAAQVTNCCDSDPCDLTSSGTLTSGDEVQVCVGGNPFTKTYTPDDACPTTPTTDGSFDLVACDGGDSALVDPDALPDAVGCTGIEFMVRQSGQWVTIDIATLKACLTPTMCEIQAAE